MRFRAIVRLAAALLLAAVSVPAFDSIGLPSPESYGAQALWYYRRGMFFDAAESARAAVSRGDRTAWNTLAAASNALDRWQDGADAALQAVRFNPDDQLAVANLEWSKQNLNATPEGRLNLSLSWYRQGKYEKAIQAAREALKLRPEYAEAWNNIAAALNCLSRWDDAIQAAEEAVRLKPDFELARNNLAWARHQKEGAHQ